MTVSKEENKESKKISQLINKIDNIDEIYVNSESDIIFQKQPFLISLILGYRLDIKEIELDEILRIIFLIWEFFKSFELIQKNKISEDQFNRVLQRNIHMLKYIEGEQGKDDKFNLVASDLSHLRFKALLTGIFYQFNNKKPLINMDNETRGQIMIGMKSLIECFEEIINKK